MENSYKKSAVSYGITLGVISALLTVVLYAVDLSLFTKWWVGVLSFLLVIIFGVVSAKKTKQLVEGFTSFKQAFTGYFITIVLGTLIGTIVTAVLFNVVDTEAASIVQEQTIEVQQEMLEGFGMAQADIDKALAEIEETNQFSFVNIFKSWVFSLAFYAVIGLIVALIFREKDPNKA